MQCSVLQSTAIKIVRTVRIHSKYNWLVLNLTGRSVGEFPRSPLTLYDRGPPHHRWFWPVKDKKYSLNGKKKYCKILFWITWRGRWSKGHYIHFWVASFANVSIPLYFDNLNSRGQHRIVWTNGVPETPTPMSSK